MKIIITENEIKASEELSTFIAEILENADIGNRHLLAVKKAFSKIRSVEVYKNNFMSVNYFKDEFAIEINELFIVDVMRVYYNGLETIQTPLTAMLKAIKEIAKLNEIASAKAAETLSKWL